MVFEFKCSSEELHQARVEMAALCISRATHGTFPSSFHYFLVCILLPGCRSSNKPNGQAQRYTRASNSSCLSP